MAENEEKSESWFSWLRNSMLGRTFGLQDEGNNEPGFVGWFWGFFKNSMIGRWFGLADKEEANTNAQLKQMQQAQAAAQVAAAENTPQTMAKQVSAQRTAAPARKASTRATRKASTRAASSRDRRGVQPPTTARAVPQSAVNSRKEEEAGSENVSYQLALKDGQIVLEPINGIGKLEKLEVASREEQKVDLRKEQEVASREEQEVNPVYAAGQSRLVDGKLVVDPSIGASQIPAVDQKEAKKENPAHAASQSRLVDGKLAVEPPVSASQIPAVDREREENHLIGVPTVPSHKEISSETGKKTLGNAGGKQELSSAQQSVDNVRYGTTLTLGENGKLVLKEDDTQSLTSIKVYDTVNNEGSR